MMHRFRWRFWAWCLFVWPLSATCAYLSVVAYREEVHIIDTYLPVRVRVLQVEVGEKQQGSTSWRRRNTRIVGYWPSVSYAYEVDGKSYVDTQVTPQPSYGTPWWARGLANRFRVGDLCTAYRDPVDPSCAFLVREVDLDNYAVLLAALLLAMLPFLREASHAEKGTDPAANRPSASLRFSMVTNLSLAVLWSGGSAIILGHYLATVGPRGNPNVFGYCALAVLIGVTQLRAGVRARGNRERVITEEAAGGPGPSVPTGM